MNAARFAAELADRVKKILPDGFDAWAEDHWVCFAETGSEASKDSVLVVEEEPSQSPGISVYEVAALNVLGSVQDEITLATTDPWPPHDPGAERPGMALPFARLDGGVLSMGYGTADRPVLALRPLQLS